MDNQNFAGDKKVGVSLLWKYEQAFIARYVSKIPPYIETYHLTLSSLVWCFFIIIFGYLAKSDINWFWGINIMILLQYLSDAFDGAVGRLRGTGLIKWGFYMDHFLDYIFLCSILISYSFLYNDTFNTLFFILVTFGAFMVNSYLSFAATNQFKISYFKIGPTEVRLGFIITNILIILFYRHVPLIKFLPVLFWASLVGLVMVVYKTQKELWKLDMEEKERNKE